jgi:hypothetical protein
MTSPCHLCVPPSSYAITLSSVCPSFVLCDHLVICVCPLRLMRSSCHLHVPLSPYEITLSSVCVPFLYEIALSSMSPLSPYEITVICVPLCLMRSPCHPCVPPSPYEITLSSACAPFPLWDHLVIYMSPFLLTRSLCHLCVPL